MVFIYVLKLGNNKYYIGKTTNPRVRLVSHFGEETTSWVRKYSAEQIIELIPDCDDHDEDKYTIKYMKKYGISNVRGGSFCEINLSPDNYSTLQKMIKGSEDKCYTCGKKGHYARDCKGDASTYDKILKGTMHKRRLPFTPLCSKEEMDWECQYCGKEFNTEEERKEHQILYCLNYNKQKKYYINTRVIIENLETKPELNGKIGRIAGSADYERDLSANELAKRRNPYGENAAMYAPKEFEKLYVSKSDGRVRICVAIQGSTYNIQPRNIAILTTSWHKDFSKRACQRCGRLGHLTSTCYEGKDVNGKHLTNTEWFER